MDWIQVGDVMVNIGVARRLRFRPHSMKDRPAPTVIVEFDDDDEFTLHGEQAAILWCLYEMRETGTRDRFVVFSKEAVNFGNRLQSIRMSNRSPAVDEVIASFDFTSKAPASPDPKREAAQIARAVAEAHGGPGAGSKIVID